MTSSLCFSESVYKTCQRQLTELKLGKLIVHSKFHKICKYDKKWRHNDIITKNNGNCGAPRNQTNYKSFERYWWELSENVHFIEFEPLCQKLWTFMSIFGIFHDARSPNMAMSRGSRSKFRKKLLFPNSAFNIWKSYKVFSRKALYFRSYQPKTSRGGGKTLLGLSFCCFILYQSSLSVALTSLWSVWIEFFMKTLWMFLIMI